jgi:hypothetical protein
MLRRPRTYMFAGLALLVPLCAWLLRAQLTERIDSYSACANAGYPVTQTYPPTCSDGRHTYLGPPSNAAPLSAAQSSVEFQLLVQGDSGGSYPKRQEVLTTAPEWQKYWQAVHAGLPSMPPILPVDFGTSSVIALSEGQQRTNGYNLQVTSVVTGTSGTTIGVTESIPTITCQVAQAETNRYYIAKTAKLTPPVSFRITTDHRHCQ